MLLRSTKGRMGENYVRVSRTTRANDAQNVPSESKRRENMRIAKSNGTEKLISM